MQFGRLALFSLLLLLSSCQKQQTSAAGIAEMFAGPSALQIREQIAPKSAVTATAAHGDRLEVMEYRRRFARVRTVEGKEGWVDVRLLLTPEQMAELRTMAQKSASLPSQGAATTFEALNMHTAPSRTSPSFVQIPENGKVDVVAHKLTPRVQQTDNTVPIRIVRPKPVRKRSKEKQAANKVPPPPPPPAPDVPRNWLALSVPKANALGEWDGCS